jgi:hypothetical protein
LDHGGFVGLTFQVGTERQPIDISAKQATGRDFEVLAKALLLRHRFSPHIEESQGGDKSGCKNDSITRQMNFIFTRTEHGSDSSKADVAVALGNPGTFKSLVAVQQYSEGGKSFTEKLYSKYVEESPSKGYFEWRVDSEDKTGRVCQIPMDQHG